MIRISDFRPGFPAAGFPAPRLPVCKYMREKGHFCSYKCCLWTSPDIYKTYICKNRLFLEHKKYRNRPEMLDLRHSRANFRSCGRALASFSCELPFPKGGARFFLLQLPFPKDNARFFLQRVSAPNGRRRAVFSCGHAPGQFSSFTLQQETKWFGSTSSSFCGCLQASVAYLQRAAKRQPGAGLIGEVSSPFRISRLFGL